MKSIFILAATACCAFAGSPLNEPPAVASPAESSDWWMTIAPYAWITATEGDMGVAGIVAPVDISMKDTLDELEIAAMLAIQAGYGRWAFGLDMVYGESGSSADLPAGAAPFDGAEVDFDQFFGLAYLGYQIVRDESLTLTAFAGVRYTHLSTEIVLNDPAGPDITVSGSKSWADPVVGLQGIWDINDRWFLYGGGDIGGFGVGSDLIWEATATVGYRFNESVAAILGYRGFGVDYTDGGFLIDTVAHGPVMGLSIRF